MVAPWRKDGIIGPTFRRDIRKDPTRVLLWSSQLCITVDIASSDIERLSSRSKPEWWWGLPPARVIDIPEPDPCCIDTLIVLVVDFNSTSSCYFTIQMPVDLGIWSGLRDFSVLAEY